MLPWPAWASSVSIHKPIWRRNAISAERGALLFCFLFTRPFFDFAPAFFPPHTRSAFILFFSPSLSHMLFTDSCLAYARLGKNSPSVPQHNCFRVWKSFKRFYCGGTDPFHSQLHLKFIECISREDLMTRPWFSISFEISSLGARPARHKAHHSPILDRLLKWHSVVSGPVCFFFFCFFFHLAAASSSISETFSRGMEAHSHYYYYFFFTQVKR